MGTYEKRYDTWTKKVRQEFKDSEYYEEGIGEDFTVTEDGSIYMNNGHNIQKVVTPWVE